MISRRADADAVAATPQDMDDILSLRRAIGPGDAIYGRATWVIKRERQYARPDRGERVRITLGISADRISLDHALDTLRISGTIIHSDHEAVPRGGRHSIMVGIGDAITIRKERWTKVHRSLLRNREHAGFVLVAIDRTECGFARLHGTRIDAYPTVRSGWGGKRYAVPYDVQSYMEQAARAAADIHVKGDHMVVFGPGTTKNRLANHLAGMGHHPRTAEGVDSGGDEGIRLFARSDILRKAVSESRLAGAVSTLEEVMAMAGRGGKRFTMGYAETAAALKAGAVDRMVYSEGLFQDNAEEDVVGMLNAAEASGVTMYGVDSSTDTGLRVTKLGGVVAVLRYAVS